MTPKELAANATSKLGTMIGEAVNRDGVALGDAMNEYEAWLETLFRAVCHERNLFDGRDAAEIDPDKLDALADRAKQWDFETAKALREAAAALRELQQHRDDYMHSPCHEHGCQAITLKNELREKDAKIARKNIVIKAQDANVIEQAAEIKRLARALNLWGG